jgi:hypothetical protein
MSCVWGGLLGVVSSGGIQLIQYACIIIKGEFIRSAYTESHNGYLQAGEPGNLVVQEAAQSKKLEVSVQEASMMQPQNEGLEAP